MYPTTLSLGSLLPTDTIQCVSLKILLFFQERFAVKASTVHVYVLRRYLKLPVRYESRMLPLPPVFNSYMTKKIEYATHREHHFGDKCFNPTRNVKNSQTLKNI